jgi:hypothetical protein
MLLRLYPSRFRAAYGDEALLLFRDRVRDEQGLVAKLRLWMDIFADAVRTVLRDYGRSRPTPAVVSTGWNDGAPQLNVLPCEVPRPSALLFGGMLALFVFGSLFVWLGHGHNYRVLKRWHGPTKHSANAGATAHPALHGARYGEIEVSAPGESAYLVLASLHSGQLQPEPQAAQPTVQDATAAMIQAIESHKIVMFGETHANKQEYEWLCNLVKNAQFADRVDDIVVEFGNSLYQKSVDRYISGEDVPIEQVQKAWRNMVGSYGPPSPVYEWFYKAVRDSNLQHRGAHQIRLLLGDPYGDWGKINNAEDLGPYLANREQWYAQVVKDAVLAKKHRALLIMGGGHFLRRHGAGYIEQELRAGGADPYLVVFGTNAVGGYDDLDPRFDPWPLPAIVSVSGNWVGALPAMPVVTGGVVPAGPLKLADVTDAMLYVGSRNALTEVNMPQSELAGTAYGRELARRIMIETGQSIEFTQPSEDPQFHRPHQQAGPGGPHALPPPPKSIHDPLPPRPPAQ